MRIRFPKEITLRCVEILVGEYDGQECELDMNCNVIFGAGHEYDGVVIDEETPTNVRLLLRDSLVAFDVPRSAFEIVESVTGG